MNTGKKNLDVMSEATFYNRWLYEQIKPYLKGKVLEIGAGIGTFSEMAKEDFKVTAIDIDKRYIKKLKTLLKDSGGAGLGNIEKGKYYFKRKRFDSAYSLNVFEHIKDDEKAMENTAKLLEKNSNFVILVPAHQILFGAMDKPLGHFRRYSKKELKEKLEKAGFKIEQIKYLNMISAIGWFITGKILRKKIIPSGQLGIFDKLIAPPLLFIERFINPPFGLSVMAVAKKK